MERLQTADAPRRTRGRSKVSEAKRRARNVKAGLVASAVAVFAVVGVAVKAAHPGHRSSGSASASRGTRDAAQLSAPSDFQRALSEEDVSSQGGFISPAQSQSQSPSPPPVSTSTS
jgi:hypothetical protein